MSRIVVVYEFSRIVAKSIVFSVMITVLIERCFVV